MAATQQSPPHRVALVIQYLGTHFHGWQRQQGQRTVQEEIEKALGRILGRPVTLHGAGRTDAGVHAAAQVAHFDAIGSIPPERWAAILNSHLPKDILIRASSAVGNRWHARFCAKWRRYRYTLYTDPRPNLFVLPFSWHYYYEPLDEDLIQAAMNPLIGHHHLAAFHRAGSNRAHSWVEVQAAECYRQEPFLYIEIQADGFLYGMVRLLVGLLVQVGRGQRSPDSFTELWKQQRREEVKYAAPAHGLCLLRVGYPEFPFSPEVWYDTQPKFFLPQEETRGAEESRGKIEQGERREQREQGGQIQQREQAESPHIDSLAEHSSSAPRQFARAEEPPHGTDLPHATGSSAPSASPATPAPPPASHAPPALEAPTSLLNF